MWRWFIPALFVCATVSAQIAPIPTASETPERPFAIRNKWVIGGVGNWGYLTVDPTARQLFVTHGSTIQVVDLSSGAVAGTIGGFRDAHQVVLDPNGQVAYVADGPANLVRIIDRRAFQIIASIPTGPSPRSLAYDASSGLLAVICSGSAPTPPSGGNRGHAPGRRPSPIYPPPSALSTLTLVDPEKRIALADITLPGRFAFAQGDGNGGVYVSVADRNGVARLDLQAIAARVEADLGARPATPAGNTSAQGQHAATPKFDWSGASGHMPEDVRPRWISIGSDCYDPHGIALDGHRNRLFVACTNQKMAVANLDTGSPVTSLTIGPGADAIVYDANRNLIFTANGGGYGSLTVIQQHVTDSYAVVQNLATLAQAHTMAVDPSSGDVYLVTSLYGAKLGNPPANGIGTLKMDAVEGSFQVLVIGNE